jgi:hypothetical protein
MLCRTASARHFAAGDNSPVLNTKPISQQDIDDGLHPVLFEPTCPKGSDFICHTVVNNVDL